MVGSWDLPSSTIVFYIEHVINAPQFVGEHVKSSSGRKLQRKGRSFGDVRNAAHPFERKRGTGGIAASSPHPPFASD